MLYNAQGRPLQTTENANVTNDPWDRIALGQGRRLTHGGKRDVPQVLGYVENPGFEEFLVRWRRRGIVTRIVDLPIRATWSNDIQIGAPGSTLESVKLGPFEFEDVNKRLKLVRRLMRLDRLAMMSKFAVLLIGVKPDGDERASLEQPVEQRSLRSLDDLLFLQAYPERDVQILSSDTDPGSARFGEPEVYQIQTVVDAARGRKEPINVHWSRVIHVAWNSLFDEVWGTPFLLQIIDHIDDVTKVVGGASEMFWQGAARDLVVKLDADAQFNQDDADALKTQVLQMLHGLSRVLHIQGGDVDTLAPTAPDPRGTAAVLFQIISAVTGIPQRVLLGSERGELASTQDRENFAKSIEERRDDFAEPVILRPLLERFQFWGALPEGDFELVWPSALALTETDRAEIAEKRSVALKNVATPGLPGEVATVAERRELIGLPAQLPLELTSADEAVRGADLDEADDAVQAGFEPVDNQMTLPVGGRNGQG